MNVVVRSTKYNPVSPLTRYVDLLNITTLPQYDDYTKWNGGIKPMIMLLCDGSTEGNPRFFLAKMMYALMYRQLKPQFFMILVNAPGMLIYMLIYYIFIHIIYTIIRS